MRQVRRQACGRAAELEREAGYADKAQVGLMPRWRVDIIRKEADHLGTASPLNDLTIPVQAAALGG